MEMMDISPLCYMLMEMGQYCCLYRIYRLSEAVLSVFTYNLTFPQDTDMYPGHWAGFGMALINCQYLYPDFQLLPLLGFFYRCSFPQQQSSPKRSHVLRQKDSYWANRLPIRSSWLPVVATTPVPFLGGSSVPSIYVNTLISLVAQTYLISLRLKVGHLLYKLPKVLSHNDTMNIGDFIHINIFLFWLFIAM